jgi:tRNA(Ile)-lysidine synthase
MKILCVSGGVDSMVMLHNFEHYYDEDYVIAHVNYNYREDSKLDEELVKKYANLYNKKFELLTLEKYTGSGFEEWARNVRYKWFHELREKYNASCIVTAHNANDQVETIIMNKRRGCSLYGLGGMRENPIHERPLLWVDKDSIYHYAEEHELEWREDYTNKDIRFKRNKIRSFLTKTRVDKLIEYCKQKQNEYEQYLKRSKTIYSEVLNKENVYLIDAPKQGFENEWYTVFHSNFKNMTQLNKKHFQLLISNDSSKRVVMLPNKCTVSKLKNVFLVEKE